MSSAPTTTMVQAPQDKLSAETLARFDREVAKYPADQAQSAVMACLTIVQHEAGWVSPQHEREVAAHLGMEPGAFAALTSANFDRLFPKAAAWRPA